MRIHDVEETKPARVNTAARLITGLAAGRGTVIRLPQPDDIAAMKLVAQADRL